MKVFISGASGLLGSNCLKYFKDMKWDVAGSHLSYATDKTVFYNTLEPQHPENFDVVAFQPDVIVHCGALTHVDYCETHPEESYEKTVTSTRNLIALSKKCNAKFVFISTDYVFDGKSGPYREDAPVNPLSIYGKHKLEAETLALNELENTLVLRITNVYGDEIRKKNFIARIVEQCEQGKKLTLTLPYDQFASPTNAFDIARAMFILLKDGKSGIYHIGGSDYMNRVELAQRVLTYFPDAEYDLLPVSTESMKQPAARPLIGGFVKMKFASEYPEFLFSTIDEYLSNYLKKD
ncbi:SDR family oxidoreductase [Taibaiella lutea]|uniref:dTDP-4-dehydrorhamnose reductase n=1 Tax=Taibaiella lutea TaxID=2608001 RepID=A0A5M6CMW8_9BACT|nr:SDR family oxidoreductase [Taibaiella lutea]KAA5536484.1 SDR family oxidoreductase [Taibaiella lutea]